MAARDSAAYSIFRLLYLPSAISLPFLPHIVLHLGSSSAVTLPYAVFLLHYGSHDTSLAPFILCFIRESKSLLDCCSWVWF